MSIEITVSDPAFKPRRASADAAAYDLFAVEGGVISVGQTAFVDTGVCIDLSRERFVANFRHDPDMQVVRYEPRKFCGLIIPRSGLGCRHGIRPGNAPGLIDPDYRGPIKVCLRNDGDMTFLFNPGDRIAQLLIIPFVTPELSIVQKLGATDRDVNGFGSTGA